MFHREIKNRGEHRVSDDYEEGRLYDRAGSGAAYGIGASVDTEPFQASDVSDDGREHHALDESGDYVVQGNGSQHIMAIKQWRQAGAEEHEQPTGQDAEDIRNDAEARNRNQSGQIFGREDEFYWFERHDAEEIEFFRNFHRPDLSRERRSGAPTHGDRGEQRSEVAGKAHRDQFNSVGTMKEPGAYFKKTHLKKNRRDLENFGLSNG